MAGMFDITELLSLTSLTLWGEGLGGDVGASRGSLVVFSFIVATVTPSWSTEWT